MRLRVTIDGRAFDLLLPDCGDVHVDLSSCGPLVGTLPKLSMRARRLLQKLAIEAQSAGVSRVVVDIPVYCESLSMTPVKLGRSLGDLERVDLVQRFRKRNRGGQVTSYEVELQRDVSALVRELSGVPEVVGGEATEWSMVLTAIREANGDEAVRVYVALCKLADIDGGVMASPSDIVAALDAPDVPISTIVNELEEGEFLTIQDFDRLLCATISNFPRLRSAGMPWESWQTEERSA